MIEAKKSTKLFQVFSDHDFWEKRRKILDIDLMFQRMFVELSLMDEAVRKELFQSTNFCDILYDYGMDLFDKGLFPQLKKLGFTLPLYQNYSFKILLCQWRI